LEFWFCFVVVVVVVVVVIVVVFVFNPLVTVIFSDKCRLLLRTKLKALTSDSFGGIRVQDLQL